MDQEEQQEQRDTARGEQNIASALTEYSLRAVSRDIASSQQKRGEQKLASAEMDR